MHISKDLAAKVVPTYLMLINAVLFVLLFAGCNQTEQSFPSLPAGVYTGSISGITENQVPLYLEIPADSGKALLVIFEEGAGPQLVPIEQRSNPEGVKETAPLVLYHDGELYTLRGDSNERSGIVAHNDVEVGKWQLPTSGVHIETGPIDNSFLVMN